MNVFTAIRKIEESLPDMKEGEVWYVLSKNGNKRCTLTNLLPEEAGFKNSDIRFVYEHRPGGKQFLDAYARGDA